MNSLMVPIIFLTLWQILAMRINNIIILPDIKSVTNILIKPNQSLIGIGSLFKNIYVSLLRVMIGYFLAIALAVPLGVLIGYSKKIEKILMGFLNMFRPVPPLAWVPLILAWFGVASMATILGIEPGNIVYSIFNNIKVSMIFIIFIGAFFPIITNTVSGIQAVRKTLVDSALILGASKFDILIKVLLPGALPTIVTGLRIGLGSAWMTLVCAEMLPGSIAGAGYMISHAYQVTRIDIVVAGVIAISLVGTSIDMVFQIIEKRSFKWQSMSR